MLLQVTEQIFQKIIPEHLLKLWSRNKISATTIMATASEILRFYVEVLRLHENVLEKFCNVRPAGMMNIYIKMHKTI